MKQSAYTETSLRKCLAENLTYLRHSKQPKLSQKAVARILNLPQKTIMNYENGRTSPMAYAVYRLAGYYGCTMEELLTKNLRKERKNQL